jgi:kynurenine formamidase
LLTPTQRNGRPNMVYPMRRDDPRSTDVVCDDSVELALQYSTQWDALAHFGQEFDADCDGKREIVFYNGYRGGEDIVGPIDYVDDGERSVDGPYGAHALGIENVARSCVQGRGVMIDLKAHFGVKRTLIGYDALMRVLAADGVTVEPGDIACFRTGFAERLLQMDRRPDADLLRNSFAVLDGRDDRLLQWITDANIVAIVADNQAVEALPARPGESDHVTSLPLHEHCLFKLGVYLGEYWFLEELADWLRSKGRSRFLLTAPPLRLPHAVGSPVTPVGTV